MSTNPTKGTHTGPQHGYDQSKWGYGGGEMDG
jgi:hypothetical protein